jgi:pyruvate kinase
VLGEATERQPHAIASLAEGREELRTQADRALGVAESHHPDTPRIMVTMPAEAAADPRLVRDLLLGGMQIMRVNCAHDSEREWSAMIRHARAAMRRTGKRCLIMMDIAGPKVRTGMIEPGPRVASWNPPRDALGTLARRARVFLYPTDAPVPPVRQLPAEVDEALPLAPAFLRELSRAERIQFLDARGMQRELIVEKRGRCRFGPLHEPLRGVFATSPHAAYVVPGTVLATRRLSVVVGDLPQTPRSIILFEGDLLVLSADQTPGRDCAASEKGRHPPVSRERFAARVPFTLPRVLRDVRPGHRVMLDDGKIAGLVIAASAQRALIRITSSRPEGTRLMADKGVNLPDTPMRVGALTARDRADLDFVARHADLVGLSFAREQSDLRDLRRELSKRRASHVGVILKVETARAFENLPNLLLEGLRSGTFGVMIARGDLAVEIGWERLAEVQEEILCLCEAAHTPVVWATQVLETLAKKGLPSRSEITDAAMGHRAECVMLNKGPYVVRAVRALRDILRRMEGHQSKRRQMLRALHVAERFVRES